MVARRPKPPQHVLLIDQSEQSPFYFVGTPTLREPLLAGHYSIRSADVPKLETMTCVERKSVADAVRTLSWERDDFEAELTRMQSYATTAVVVEGSLREFAEFSCGMKPKARIATVIAYQQRYPRTHWTFCPNAAWAGRWTQMFLERVLRDVREGKRPSMSETGDGTVAAAT